MARLLVAAQAAARRAGEMEAAEDDGRGVLTGDIYARYARVRAEVLRREHEAAAAEVEARRCVGGGVGGVAGGGGDSNGAKDEAEDGRGGGSGARGAMKRRGAGPAHESGREGKRSYVGEEGNRGKRLRREELAEGGGPPEVVGGKRRRGGGVVEGGRSKRIPSGSR